MFILLLNILLLINSFNGDQHDFPEAFERRTEKVLKPIFNTEDFHYEPMAEIEFTSLYKLNANSVFSGYLVITSSKGRFERFQYMVLYSPKVEVLKVKVLQYNSSRGTGVTSKRWLKQFEGNKGEKLKYGKDIQAITGATYSATSITEDIPVVTQWVSEMVK